MPEHNDRWTGSCACFRCHLLWASPSPLISPVTYHFHTAAARDFPGPADVHRPVMSKQILPSQARDPLRLPRFGRCESLRDSVSIYPIPPQLIKRRIPIARPLVLCSEITTSHRVRRVRHWGFAGRHWDHWGTTLVSASNTWTWICCSLLLDLKKLLLLL